MTDRETAVKKLGFILNVMDEIATENRVYISLTTAADGYTSMYMSSLGEAGKGETVNKPKAEDIQRLIEKYAV